MNAHEYFKHVAFLTAQLSPVFTKCGALIVTDDTQNIVSIGYNHHRLGVQQSPDGSHVCHAEVKAIQNLDENVTGELTMYVTLAPCVKCAKAIVDAQIFTVFCGPCHPDPKYKCAEALDYLRAKGVILGSL